MGQPKCAIEILTQNFLDEIKKVVFEKEETVREVLEECEKLRNLVKKKDEKILTLQEEVQNKNDDLLSKDLELHRKVSLYKLN